MNGLAALPTSHAVGFGGNYIVVDPAHDIVVVTRWMDSNKMGELTRWVVKAVEKNDKERQLFLLVLSFFNITPLRPD